MHAFLHQSSSSANPALPKVAFRALHNWHGYVEYECKYQSDKEWAPDGMHLKIEIESAAMCLMFGPWLYKRAVRNWQQKKQKAAKKCDKDSDSLFCMENWTKAMDRCFMWAALAYQSHMRQMVLQWEQLWNDKKWRIESDWHSELTPSSSSSILHTTSRRKGLHFPPTLSQRSL